MNGTVPAEDAPLVEALQHHIDRCRAIDRAIVVMLVIIVIAMGVGSWLIYHNVTQPARTLAIVDKELAAQREAQRIAGQQTLEDVCSFLRSNHLKASKAVQRDFKCPLHGHHSSSPSTAPGTSSTSTSTTPAPGSTTIVVTPGPGSTSKPRQHSGGGSTPPPSPTPTPSHCDTVSVLGKCLL